MFHFILWVHTFKFNGRGELGTVAVIMDDFFSQSPSVLRLLHQKPQKCSLEMSYVYVM